jgi:hypothetical protein
LNSRFSNVGLVEGKLCTAKVLSFECRTWLPMAHLWHRWAKIFLIKLQKINAKKARPKSGSATGLRELYLQNAVGQDKKRRGD